MKDYLENSMHGKILSVVAGVYRVYLENKETVEITPRGVFRLKKIKPCVGDEVEVEDNQIVDVNPRKNKIIRPNISNIDLGIIVMSMEEPVYSSYLLDKFITMLYQNEIEVMVVLTKIDLLKNTDKLNQIIQEYASCKIKVIPYNHKTKENLELIKNEIRGKTIAFTGQTGVGKSSLINDLSPELNRKIGEYSTALNRGKHQTKEVCIFPYENGYIADTPGFSSLELDCYKEDLKKYYPFFSHDEVCFFNDCNHINEPKCGVREKVNCNLIPLEHYNNYKDLFDELIYRKDRFDK